MTQDVEARREKIDAVIEANVIGGTDDYPAVSRAGLLGDLDALFDMADRRSSPSRIEVMEKALRYARPLLVKYAYTQGNHPDFVREITAPLDAALPQEPEPGR